jgi:DNA-binding HxlR family transcriptional regulator
LLIVRDLVGGPRRFVELQRVLPGISTEQLRSRLNRMVADGLLTRQRYREVPPRVDYELTERARDLLPVIGALARWGYQWTWSPPRPEEQVDIGAILRSLCGLAAPAGVEGSIELMVGRGGPSANTYTMTATAGNLTLTEGPAEDADARIAGPERAWVEALGPDASRTELDLEGDRRLGDALLDLLAPIAAREAAVA